MKIKKKLVKKIINEIISNILEGDNDRFVPQLEKEKEEEELESLPFKDDDSSDIDYDELEALLSSSVSDSNKEIYASFEDLQSLGDHTGDAIASISEEQFRKAKHSIIILLRDTMDELFPILRPVIENVVLGLRGKTVTPGQFGEIIGDSIGRFIHKISEESIKDSLSGQNEKLVYLSWIIKETTSMSKDWGSAMIPEFIYGGIGYGGTSEQLVQFFNGEFPNVVVREYYDHTDWNKYNESNYLFPIAIARSSISTADGLETLREETWDKDGKEASAHQFTIRNAEADDVGIQKLITSLAYNAQSHISHTVSFVENEDLLRYSGVKVKTPYDEY